MEIDIHEWVCDVEDTTTASDHRPRSTAAGPTSNSWLPFNSCFTTCELPPTADTAPSWWESKVATFNTLHSMDSIGSAHGVCSGGGDVVPIPAIVDARERLGLHRFGRKSGSDSITGTQQSPQVIATASVPVSRTEPTHLHLPVRGGVLVTGESSRGANRQPLSSAPQYSESSAPQYSESSAPQYSESSAPQYSDEGADKRGSQAKRHGMVDSYGNTSVPGDDPRYVATAAVGPLCSPYLKDTQLTASDYNGHTGDVNGAARYSVDHRHVSESDNASHSGRGAPVLTVQYDAYETGADDSHLEISSTSSSCQLPVEALASVAGGVAVASAVPVFPRSKNTRSRTVRFSQSNYDDNPSPISRGDSPLSCANSAEGRKWELPVLIGDDGGGSHLAIRSHQTTNDSPMDLLILPSRDTASPRSSRKVTYSSPYIPAYDVTMDPKLLMRMTTTDLLLSAKRRSAQARPRRTGVDEMGFITDDDDDLAVRTEMYNRTFEEKATKRETRWASYLRRNPYLKPSRRLKVLVRKGVPNFFRQLVWSTCVGSRQLLEEQPKAYNRYKAAEIPEAVENQIALDIRRTFPQHVQFSACEESDTQSGPARLARVLHAVAACDAEVAYCQSMNFIAASLLLFMEEALAFWTMMQILQTRVDGKGMQLSSYYTPNLVGLRRDILVLRWLLKIKLPNCCAVLEENQVELEWICSEWFLCLFASVLPNRVCFRLWDVMMYEGDKLLFRMSLAIFKFHETMILQLANDFEKLLFFLKSMARQIVDHNRLMNVALKGLGTFSRKTIVELRSQAISKIEADAAQRRR
eukprot:Lankesteria_metandrocarpae@DN5426_c1_g1_i1.p1